MGVRLVRGPGWAVAARGEKQGQGQEREALGVP